MVRYHHPAENVAEFISHYIADHPPILGKLPQIRSVLCYLPVDVGLSDILAPADYMIGNEVASIHRTPSMPRWRRRCAMNCSRISKAFRRSAERTRIIR